MSTPMVALETPASKPMQACLRHRKRRTGIRIDMTPMVDIALLLLIFFMVTTVFRQPQAMEVVLPEPYAVRVPDSNVLLLKVEPSGNLHWHMGRSEPLKQTSLQDLQRLLLHHSKLNPELIVLVKLHRSAPYGVMVNVLDEIEIAGISRFSLAPLEEGEQEPQTETL